MSDQVFSPGRRILYMAALIVAGEAIFVLPFHITRYFRPTFLDVFGFDNTQLGGAQAVYGIVAMLAYFPGGPIADRFSAQKLMVASLLSTAAGGFYLANLPGVEGMAFVMGFWGLTSILLFWAALIRATRDWGGQDGQGRAFGILDGGRGLFAAALTMGAVWLFAWVMPAKPSLATLEQQQKALTVVIFGYTAFTAFAAMLVWIAIPATKNAPEATSSVSAAQGATVWGNILLVIERPTIWLQAAIVVAAYVGYKGTDYYSLFAADVYGMDEVSAAKVGAVSAWVRPVAALLAGLAADRFLSSKVISVCFGIAVLVFGYMAIMPINVALVSLLFAEVVLGCAAIYGLRGVYFTLFEEARLPAAVTGTAVGIVSLVGYTPDIFVGPIAGYLLDSFPGAEGHQYFMLFVAVFSMVGGICSLCFTFLNKQPSQLEAPRP